MHDLGNLASTNLEAVLERFEPQAKALGLRIVNLAKPTASDGVLKPFLLGRGSGTPVGVILIGAIGGLPLHGLIGLFVEAVVFSTGHRLFRRWMETGGDLVLSPPADFVIARGPAPPSPRQRTLGGRRSRVIAKIA